MQNVFEGFEVWGQGEGGGGGGEGDDTRGGALEEMAGEEQATICKFILKTID